MPLINKLFTVGTISLVLFGCSGEESTEPVEKNKVGSDRDEYGCIASAGYAWCARINSCERPWDLAQKHDFENTPEGFSVYCGESSSNP